MVFEGMQIKGAINDYKKENPRKETQRKNGPMKKDRPQPMHSKKIKCKTDGNISTMSNDAERTVRQTFD